MTKTIRIIFLSYMVLILAASSLTETSLWGASAWLAVSFTTAVVLAVILSLLLSGRISGRVQNLIPERPSPSKWAEPAVYISAIILMWIFRYGHRLWGDGAPVARALEEGVWLRPGAPLAMLLNYGAFRFLNMVFLWNSLTATMLVSMICGLFFLCASITASRLCVEGSWDDTRTVALGSLFLVANGFISIFFGGGGNIPPALLLTSFFIISSIFHLRSKAPLYIPALVMLVALLTHLSTAYLVIGFVVILVHDLRRTPYRTQAMAMLLFLPSAWLAVELVFPYFSTGPGITKYLLLSLRGIPLFNMPPGIPFADWGNELLIIGPAGIVALVMLFSWRRKPVEENFLASLAVGALLFMLIGTGRVMRGLRWDVAAASGPALAFYALWALKNRSRNMKDFRLALLLIASLGIFQTIPLIAANHSYEYGEDRILDLPLSPGFAERTLGLHALELEEYETAEEWLDRSSVKEPGDDLTWYSLGRIAMREDLAIDAIEDFTKALRLAPTSELYIENLAEAYLEKRWYEEAIGEWLKLTEKYPGNLHYRTRLGYSYNHKGQFEEAIEVYEKVLMDSPGSEEYRKNLTSALLNRGIELQEAGEFDDAKKYYYRAASIYPMDWVGAHNLAVISLEEGDYEKAYSILEKTLRTHPFSFKIHHTMGLVEEKRGNLRRAFELIRRSAELNPNVPPPNDDLNRIWNKLEEEKSD